MNKVCKILLVIVFILLFALWFFIVYKDYYNVYNDKYGTYCLKENTNKYEDGNVKVCYGLGYKIYLYDRECFKGIEFSSVFGDDSTKTMSECNK